MENKEFKILSSLLKEYSSGTEQLKGLGNTLKFLEGLDDDLKSGDFAEVSSLYLSSCGLTNRLDLSYEELVMVYRSRFNKLGIRMEELRSKLIKAEKAVG